MARHYRHDNDFEEVKTFRDRLAHLARFGLIWDLVKAHPGKLIAANLIAFITALPQMSYPLILQRVIDDVLMVASPDMMVFIGWFAIFLGLMLFNTFAGYARANLMLRISKNVLRDMRIRVIDRVLRFPVHYFETEDVGKITAKISSDVDAVDSLITRLTRDILVSFVQMIIGIVILCYFNVQLTLVTLTCVPVAIIVTHSLHDRWHKLADAERKAIADFSARITTNLNGIRVLKAFSREERESAALAQDASAIARNGIRNWSYSNLFHGLMGFIVTLAHVAALGFAGWLVIQHKLTIGQFTGFGSLFWIMMGPFSTLLDAWSMIPNGIAAYDRVHGLMTEPVEADGREIVKHDGLIRGQVRFEDVSFAYDGKVQAMQGVSFTVEPGQTVAIVGQSGAGKTTFASLLMGFYMPNSGRVLVDGIDTRNWDLQALRTGVGMVLQDTILFNDTVRENIRYGRHDAADEEILEALRIADAYDFVMALPKVLDTIVGVNGVKLSGGQKQRIAIARAVIKNPRVLLFDEATSHLDSLAEREIQKAVESVSQGRTTFLIAHRLSTVAHADMILVFDGGRIAQAGTHAELLRQDGAYKALHEAQAYRFSDGEVVTLDAD
ncbi:MAG: ABC transporter ATP-binding protein [Planctomycetes bacterium]|nr:ABC transporter ATP-binding protein [Planctomycetota bacterium]